MPAKRRRSSTPSKAIRNLSNSKIFQEKIEKAKKTELTTSDLELMLRNVKNFLGVFACDQLKFISGLHGTKFLIVNLDSSLSPGSHWICLRISKNTIEIFDSLGYNFKIWGVLPVPLLQFLSSLQKTRTLVFTPVLQPKYETVCGLYCIYFILFRRSRTFSDCVTVFDRRLELNKSILIKFFS